MKRLHILGYRSITAVALTGAAIGVAVPGIPTVPFLLLAAWSASHHSPELEARLLANPRVGPHIRAWREERALSRRAKRAALATLAVSGIVSLLLLEALLAKLAIAAILAGIAVFLLTRPEPGPGYLEPRG